MFKAGGRGKSTEIVLGEVREVRKKDSTFHENGEAKAEKEGIERERLCFLSNRMKTW